jgi:hypothetical protein
LIDQELSIVFYDLTTIRTEGSTELSGEVRRFGLSKDGGIVRQVMLGVVQTAEGLPIHHEVFAGNSGETTTLVPTIEKVLARYPIKRVVLVADRGLLSLDNLEAIRAIRVGGQPLEFILAVPARRYADFDTLLAEFHEQRCLSATEEVVGELEWQGFRLIVAHRPDTASEQGQARDDASRRWRPMRQGGRASSMLRIPARPTVAEVVGCRHDGPFLPRCHRGAPGAHHQGQSGGGGIHLRDRPACAERART